MDLLLIECWILQVSLVMLITRNNRDFLDSIPSLYEIVYPDFHADEQRTSESRYARSNLQ